MEKRDKEIKNGRRKQIRNAVVGGKLLNIHEAKKTHPINFMNY